jgi:glutamine phosphoribosylpyrophosphate amidotransferase
LPSPLYTVLLGYKESPVADARRRFGALIRALVADFLHRHGPSLAALAGGPLDVVTVVPSSRRPGLAPLALVAGLGPDVATALPSSHWEPGLLRRTAAPGGPPPVAHMRPHPAAFHLHAPGRDAVSDARVLLLDDTYVSGARSQSAAVSLHLAGARAVVIVPLGRVLRPDRVARHAEFLRNNARG